MADRDPEIRTEGASPMQAELPAGLVRKNRWLRPVLMSSLPLALLIGGGLWYVANDHYVSTDNAYIQQDKMSVSAEVSGRITQVLVKENQPVKAGQLLFIIDAEPFRLAAAQADASMAGAQAKIVGLETELSTSGVDINSAQEDVAFFEKEYHRQSALMQRGFTTKARLQAAEHALSEARSKLANARADALKARAALATGTAVPGVNPAVASARVQKEKALLDLSKNTGAGTGRRHCQPVRPVAGGADDGHGAARTLHRYIWQRLGRGQFQGNGSGRDPCRSARRGEI
jgi:membrane fusion protein (multidrug efflux system)